MTRSDTQKQCHGPRLGTKRRADMRSSHERLHSFGADEAIGSGISPGMNYAGAAVQEHARHETILRYVQPEIALPHSRHKFVIVMIVDRRLCGAPKPTFIAG